MRDLWIGRGDAVNWSARSPDLISLDSFPCDYVKETVDKTQCNSMTQLERRITPTIQNLPIDVLQNVRQNIKIRFSAVIGENEEHIRNII